jgi:hypothetical protein
VCRNAEKFERRENALIGSKDGSNACQSLNCATKPSASLKFPPMKNAHPQSKDPQMREIPPNSF